MLLLNPRKHSKKDRELLRSIAKKMKKRKTLNNPQMKNMILQSGIGIANVALLDSLSHYVEKKLESKVATWEIFKSITDEQKRRMIVRVGSILTTAGVTTGEYFIAKKYDEGMAKTLLFSGIISAGLRAITLVLPKNARTYLDKGNLDFGDVLTQKAVEQIRTAQLTRPRQIAPNRGLVKPRQNQITSQELIVRPVKRKR